MLQVLAVVEHHVGQGLDVVGQVDAFDLTVVERGLTDGLHSVTDSYIAQGLCVGEGVIADALSIAWQGDRNQARAS